MNFQKVSETVFKEDEESKTFNAFKEGVESTINETMLRLASDPERNWRQALSVVSGLLNVVSSVRYSSRTDEDGDMPHYLVEEWHRFSGYMQGVYTVTVMAEPSASYWQTGEDN